MRGTAKTYYAKSGSLYIAYQVMGDGPRDLVFVPGFVSHLDLELDNPYVARFFERLSTFCRLIRFDKRGTGLSDRLGAIPTLEERMEDVHAVMDAVGSKHAVLLGHLEAGAMSMLFSATYPERAVALILCSTYARRAWAPDHLSGLRVEGLEALINLIDSSWGEGRTVDVYTPSLANNDEHKRWQARYERGSGSPGAAIAILRMNWEIDVRHILPSISVPTLILHKKDDRVSSIEQGLFLAQHIHSTSQEPSSLNCPGLITPFGLIMQMRLQMKSKTS